MARKSHTKSRNGCIECKKRRTKCDEGRPRCCTCRRLGHPCTYKDVSGTSSLPSTRAVTPASPATIPSDDGARGILGNFKTISKTIPNDNVAPPLKMTELKLLYHFVTHTYDTLGTTDSEKKHIWQVTMIKVGFDYPFVIRGILSISALHIATKEPDTAAENLVVASTQYNAALIDFREALRDVNDDSCTAVFAFSCVTAVHALGVAQVQKPDDPIGDLQNCLNLVKGVLLILEPHLEQLGRSGVLDPGSNAVSLHYSNIPEILELRSLAESIPDDDTSKTCVQAIDQLHRGVYLAISSSEEDSHFHFLLAWPTLVPSQFFEILSSREPVAVLIITYFAAALGFKGNVWWLANWNRYIMEAAEAELTPEMQVYLEWPRRIIASSIVSSDTVDE